MLKTPVELRPLAAVGPVQYEPLPGVMYGATMQTSDIYPAVLGIGGVRTSDYTIPVFSSRVVQETQEAVGTASTLGAGLLNTPAGWLVIILLGLAAAAWYDAAR